MNYWSLIIRSDDRSVGLIVVPNRDGESREAAVSCDCAGNC